MGTKRTAAPASRRALLGLLVAALSALVPLTATGPGGRGPARATPTRTVAAVARAVAAATPHTTMLWNFTAADIYRAQPAGNNGAGVTVAVVDTWVDGSHPLFGGRVLPGADCTTGLCHPSTVASRDSCWHGTHVAGTIAASTFGVAPAARILPVRVLQADPSAPPDNGGTACVGSSEAVAAGIDYAISHGAQVINLSLGALVTSADDTVIRAAVQRAAAAGAVVVFAAGNGGSPVNAGYAASALVVAATGPDGSLASYSQTNGSSIAAPGGDTGAAGALCAADGHDCVESTYPTSMCPAAVPPAQCLAASEGTSMAAPHVSGVAALLLSQMPGRGRQDVVNRLLDTARPLAGQPFGQLQAGAALGVALLPAAEPAPVPVRSAPEVIVPAQRAPAPRAQPVRPGALATRPAATPAAGVTAGPVTVPVAAPVVRASAATVSIAHPATVAAAVLALAALLLGHTAAGFRPRRRH